MNGTLSADRSGERVLIDTPKHRLELDTTSLVLDGANPKPASKLLTIEAWGFSLRIVPVLRLLGAEVWTSRDRLYVAYYALEASRDRSGRWDRVPGRGVCAICKQLSGAFSGCTSNSTGHAEAPDLVARRRPRYHFSDRLCKMTKCLILLDNSNVFIEGKKLSARLKGVKRESTDSKDPQDPSWRIDFGQLLTFMADGRQIIEAILVGSKPPQNDSVWTSAEQNGFRVLTYVRSFSGEEKEVDTEIATQAAEIILLNKSEPGVLVLGSGDRDFLPSVRCAHRYQWTAEMCAFSSAFNPFGDMAMSVDKIRQLDVAFGEIGHCDFIWP